MLKNEQQSNEHIASSTTHFTTSSTKTNNQNHHKPSAAMDTQATASATSSAADLTLAMDSESFHAHILNAHRDICSHLYHKGFLTGLLSDVTIHAFDQSYRLHRILLVRSPFFERLMHADTAVLDLAIQDPNITPESLSICLAFLYGAPIYSHIKFMNVHAVLACACMLELQALTEICTSFIVKTLSADTVLTSVGFVTCGWTYGPCSDEIRESCLDLLSTHLPKKLHAFLDGQGREELIRLFVKLPFVWLKLIVEEKLAVPSEFEKYTFAKQVIERRKVVSMRSAVQPLPFHAPLPVVEGQAAAVVPNETVVMLFERDGSRVSLMEQASKKPLMKHPLSFARSESARHM